MRQQFSCTVEASDLGKRQVLTGTDPIALEKQGKALGDTWQAEAALEQVKNILRAALDQDHKINWEKLKRKHPFPKPEPSEFNRAEPKPEDAKYQPVLTIFDRLIKSRAEQKYQEARALYGSDHAAWEKAKQESQCAVETWNPEKTKFQREQDAGNAAFDKQRTGYESLQPDAVTGYCNFVLLTSKYPDSFPKEFDLEYIPSTKILAIDYSLPSPDKMPSVKEVKYVKSKNEFHKTQLSETELNRIYDDTLYQICLRTLYELFAADTVGALDAVVFNGWVESIDKATGNQTKGCVDLHPGQKTGISGNQSSKC